VLSALNVVDAVTTAICYCNKTCSLALARNRNLLFHKFLLINLYLYSLPLSRNSASNPSIPELREGSVKSTDQYNLVLTYNDNDSDT
jgi:hypothetical protein